jgi:hypothetical protein
VIEGTCGLSLIDHVPFEIVIQVFLLLALPQLLAFVFELAGIEFVSQLIMQAEFRLSGKDVSFNVVR